MYQHDFPVTLSYNLFALANLARLEGDLTKSEALYRECELIRRKEVNKIGLATVLGCLGEIALVRGSVNEALAIFKESLQICQEIQCPPMVLFVLGGFSGIAGVKEHYELAARLFGATEAAFEMQQSKFDTLLSNTYDPIIAAVRERLTPS